MCGIIKGSEWMKGKMVGCGSFGCVHLAMNKSTGGLFVVKKAHSEAGRDALENEVNILNTLNSSPSPYIVQCLGTDYDHQDNQLHVFMEYMSGGSLADVSHKFGGSIDEDVVRVYTRQIVHGLYHLHQHGIVHCDLKCKNVLLASSGNVKLADFGCAKRVKKNMNMNKSSSYIIANGGTPLWMAPEVLLMKNDSSINDESRVVVDFAAADIWSLGCTVIEMATGRPPWVDDDLISISNPMAAMFKIACGDGIPQFPIHFSQEGFDFLRRCLVRDPKKRSTAQELLNHPFLVSTTLTHHKHYSASSPASVLEVHQFEDTYDDDDDDDDDSDDNDELVSPAGGNHFSITKEFLCPQGTTMWQLEDSASGNHWITIRSR
jgi:mitogen-activated protein kinase kinase kinase 17/18